MENGEGVSIDCQNIQIERTANNSSELAKKLTGFDLNDVKMSDYLINDSERINKKYSLPPLSQAVNSPHLYYESLKSILKENGVMLYKDSNKDGFFSQNPDTLAAYFSKNKNILLNEKYMSDNQIDILTLLIAITHESIHALQDKNHSNQSLEEKEYEAHIGSFPFSLLPNGLKKSDIEGVFNAILNSVEIYNRQINSNQ